MLGDHDARVRPGQRDRHRPAEVTGVRVHHRGLDLPGGQTARIRRTCSSAHTAYGRRPGCGATTRVSSPSGGDGHPGAAVQLALGGDLDRLPVNCHGGKNQLGVQDRHRTGPAHALRRPARRHRRTSRWATGTTGSPRPGRPARCAARDRARARAGPRDRAADAHWPGPEPPGSPAKTSSAVRSTARASRHVPHQRRAARVGLRRAEPPVAECQINHLPRTLIAEPVNAR